MKQNCSKPNYRGVGPHPSGTRQSQFEDHYGGHNETMMKKQG